MIKLLAETKGSFQLHDLAHKGQIVHARRPCVIENSHFIQDRIGREQIRILGELRSEATDDDFVGYLKESAGDTRLAIEAFLAEFGKDAPIKKKRASKVENPDNANV